MFNTSKTSNNIFNNISGFNRSYKKIDFNKIPCFNKIKVGEKFIKINKIPTFLNLKLGEKIIKLKGFIPH